MRAELILKDASAEERAEVAALLQAAYAEHRQHFPAAVWHAYRGELDAVDDRLDVSELIVAVRDRELVGTVTLYPDGRLDGHDWPPGVASLRLLAVRPGVRGAGVGRALVSECVARAGRHGASHLGLHTATFMQAANRLYADLGFQRAPHLDFDAETHYARVPPDAATGQLSGMAYLLPLTAPAEGRA